MIPSILNAALPGVKRTSTSNSAKSTKSAKLVKAKRKPIKRALIIGIMYKDKAGEELHTPHKDAQDWRKVLIEKYAYKEGDITTMLDDEETISGKPHLVPLRDNLLREIKALVAGAQPGDRFMFYYAGHGRQIASKSMHEDDGFDEAIVPYIPSGEASPILDNLLRDLLVEPLPVGATLTAIFDSCSSGTLLDLEHYACNNVYFPWVNRGKRDLRTTRHAFIRRQTVVDNFVVKVDLASSDQASVAGTDDSHSDTSAENKPCLRICERTRSKSNVIIKRDQVVNDLSSGKKDEKRFVVTRSYTLEVPRRRDSVVVKRKPRRVFSIPHKFTFKGIFFRQCSEPETYLECDGFNCKLKAKKTKAHVISISACQDVEQTWESKSGMTMTQAMIKLLSEDQPFYFLPSVVST